MDVDETRVRSASLNELQQGVSQRCPTIDSVLLDDFFAHWTDTPLGKQLLLLIQNEMFYKNTEARLTGYNDFVNEISMEPPVQANIHFLLAKDDDGQDKSKISRDWSGQTTGKYFSYLMPGSHGVIFEPPHLEENVIVMKKILESIYTKKLVF